MVVFSYMLWLLLTLQKLAIEKFRRVVAAAPNFTEGLFLRQERALPLQYYLQVYTASETYR